MQSWHFFIVDRDVSFLYYWTTVHFATTQCMVKKYVRFEFLYAKVLGHVDHNKRWEIVGCNATSWDFGMPCIFSKETL